MCRINSCCCCCSLRCGTYLSAFYTIVVGGAIAIFLTIAVLVNHVTDDGLLRQVLDKYQADNHTDGYIVTNTKIVLYVGMGLHTAWLLAAFIMCCGVSASSRCFLIPWLTVTTLLLGFYAYGIGMGVLNIKEVTRVEKKLAEFVTYCTALLLNFYCLLCVCAFYRSHMGQEHDDYVGPESVPMKRDAYYTSDCV